MSWIALATLLATIAIIKLPFENIIGNYVDDLGKLSSGQKLHHNFTPVGYPFVLLPAYLIAGIKGVQIFQGLIYIAAIGIIANLTWRKREDGFQWVSVITMLCVTCHPYMILNINRSNDNAVSILYLATFMVWLFSKRGDSTGAWRLISIGLVIGLWTLTRPNIITVLPVVFILIYADRGFSFTSTSKALGLVLASAALTYGSAAYLTTAEATFWPSNGPYNFYAGNNEFSNNYLIRLRNAENSLEPALALHDALPIGGDPHNVTPITYSRLAKEHIMRHPAEFLNGAWLKLGVILGPDLRQAQTPLKKVVQFGLALPFFFWLCINLMVIKNILSIKRLAPIAFVMFYFLPFVISNADPRFRLPILDIFMIIHSGLLLANEFNSRIKAKKAMTSILD
jgi:hypothetical protein